MRRKELKRCLCSLLLHVVRRSLETTVVYAIGVVASNASLSTTATHVCKCSADDMQTWYDHEDELPRCRQPAHRPYRGADTYGSEAEESCALVSVEDNGRCCERRGCKRQ